VLTALPPFDPESGDLHVVIETPKGSRNKFTWDERHGLFTLGGVLPAGAVFPFDFGFVPATVGEDGDPLDVLVVMDEPAHVGCLVEARLVGVTEADQTEDGDTYRNDRVVAVAVVSRNHRDVQSIEQLGENLLTEIEHFFVSYHEIKGKTLTIRGRAGPSRALELVHQAAARPHRRRPTKRPGRSQRAHGRRLRR
jgi:inorganic pyrophosphatase